MKKGIKKLINFYYVVYGSIIIILYPYIGLMFDNIKKIQYYIKQYFSLLFVNTEYSEEYLKIIVFIVVCILFLFVFFGMYIYKLTKIYTKSRQINVKTNVSYAILGCAIGIITSIFIMYIISLFRVNGIYFYIFCFIPFTCWEIETIKQNIIIVFSGILFLEIIVIIATNISRRKIKYME